LKSGILFFILLFAFADCRAQMILNPAAKAKYDSVYLTYYPSFRKKIERGEKEGWLDGGLALTEFLKTDTLNKEEFVPDTTHYPKWRKCSPNWHQLAQVFPPTINKFKRNVPGITCVYQSWRFATAVYFSEKINRLLHNE